MLVSKVEVLFPVILGHIVAAAFDLGEMGAPLLARLPGRQNWHVFMSFAGDTPAGAIANPYVGHGGSSNQGASVPAAYPTTGMAPAAPVSQPYSPSGGYRQ